MEISKNSVISVFDTTIAEYNQGNQIIMEAVMEIINEIFGDSFIYKLPYQQINLSLRKCVNNSDIILFGGTNSLSSSMNKYKQWDLNLCKTAYIHDVIMLGIGWWQYQSDPNLYTKLILKRALSHKYIHSARDSYTANRLRKLGFKVLNTGCPTTWQLTPSLIKEVIKRKKGNNVVICLTDYNKDKDKDLKLINTCLNKYDKIYIWPQGIGDCDYVNELTINDRINIIGSSLKSFDKILINSDVDYVGTRLHAGIRALQKGCHSYIISIDNRASEMKNDIGLPVLEREKIDDLASWLDEPYNLDLKIHWDEIKKWKDQFLTHENG